MIKAKLLPHCPKVKRYINSQLQHACYTYYVANIVKKNRIYTQNQYPTLKKKLPSLNSGVQV